MKITLTNDFHDSSVAVLVPDLPYTLSDRQTRRVRDQLCGSTDCACGKVRGRQAIEVSQEGDGRYTLAQWS